ncbi:MAG: DUF1801 domain-containing protein [Bacteroidota bacterium]
MEKASTIDEYISGFPIETQKVLELVRSTIKAVVPDAVESISYAIPTFKLNGVYLVYFAGFKNHIGFYPAPIGMETFKEEFSKYKTGKGSVQFPLDKPMPLDLITRIVQFRMESNSKKAKK